MKRIVKQTYLLSLAVAAVCFFSVNIKVHANTNVEYIRTARQLGSLAASVNGGDSKAGITIKLSADITIPSDFVGIGALKPGSTDAGRGKNINPFSGTFDGGGHTISIAAGGKAVFSYLRQATIKSLNIKGADIRGNGLLRNYVTDYGPNGSYASGVPGTAVFNNIKILSNSRISGSGFVDGEASGSNTVVIENCTIEKDVTIGSKTLKACGSFAGRFNGQIKNCTSHADVTGKSNVGGIIGRKGQSMGDCSITDCEFYGTVSAGGKCAGGIAGSGYNVSSAPNTRGITIENCKVSGSVTGKTRVGGVLGAEPVLAQCWENGKHYIRNNSFTGTLATTSATGTKGGIIGYIRSLNKYDIISGNKYSKACGAEHGIGKIDYIDTSFNNPTGAGVKAVFNTADSTDGCPDIKGCTWKKSHNRTDDPIGKDEQKLCRKI